MALPFPQGASLEILVRTYEMKLQLRGTVLASHPGYGMGVAFELKTKEEQSNVKEAHRLCSGHPIDPELAGAAAPSSATAFLK